ncbi:Peptidase aspartic, catalytic [Penicillium expansum]|nr:Peptidase aspartic catalytic [Penicillium expansum]KGO45783.1 Peptidase aspartic, catalytic [Penicillium expansum]KGO66547.1 Peptidase aspartic, catalytic [Penicillium expansum]
MRSEVACLLALSGAALTNALSLEKRDNPAVLAVPMVRDTSRQLSKRSKTVGVNLNKERDIYVSYVGNVTFGSPPQSFLAYFNTWGNGCWLGSADDGVCGVYGERSLCGEYGGYNLTASTTAKKLDEKFTYDDFGELVNGDFVTDVLAIGNVTVDAMKMGIDEDSEMTSNSLGLGYGNVSSISLTQALANAGTINSPAFSLWDQTILFGGVNKARYYDSLYTFPIVNGSDLAKAFRINMDGISINETSAASNKFPLDAVFNTAYDMTYVPKFVAQALNSQIGNTSVPDDYGQVNFSCSAVGENATIEFKFGELELQFYLSDFIAQNSDVGDNEGPYPGEETCYFTICENTDLQYEGSIVLGSNFMSKVYAVFDLENDEVSLANLVIWNTLWEADAPVDIVEITSGKNGVPGAKKSSGSGKNGDSSKNGEAEAKKNLATHIKKGLRTGALVVGAAVMILIF